MVPCALIFFGFLHTEDVFDRGRDFLVAAEVGADERRHFLKRRHPHIVEDQNSTHREHAVGAEEIDQSVVEGVGAINVDVICLDPLFR